LRKKSKSSAALKQSILDTAERFFKEYGFEKTTLQMIADELGIAQGTVTYHFKNKSQMLFDHINHLFFITHEYLRENLEEEKFNYYLYYSILYISTHRQIMKDERTRALFGNKKHINVLLRDKLADVEKMLKRISDDFRKGLTEKEIRVAALLDIGGRDQMLLALNDNYVIENADEYGNNLAYHIGILVRLDEATIRKNIALAYEFLDSHVMPTILLLE